LTQGSKLKISILMAIVAVGLLAWSSAASAVTVVTPKNVLGAGSDTTYYMVTALGDLYNQSPGCNVIGTALDNSCQAGPPAAADSENFAHDVVLNRFPAGSSTGINQICKDNLAGTAHTDFARSSRVPNSDCTGLRFVGYARDGISWECFPGAAGSGCAPLVNGSNSLTITQLKNIFVNCSVTDWGQVGGVSGVPIDVYAIQANSGTGISWAKALNVTLPKGSALDNCVDNKTPGVPGSQVSAENTNAQIHANGDEDKAIMAFSAGIYQRTYGGFTGSDGSSLGKINLVAPTFANIQDGSFPVGRFLFNVYCQGDPANVDHGANHCGTGHPATSQTKKFVSQTGFICKSETAHQDSSSNPILDPLTGLPYRSAPTASGQPTGEIPDTIADQGFVPLKKQSNGGYCTVTST